MAFSFENENNNQWAEPIFTSAIAGTLLLSITNKGPDQVNFLSKYNDANIFVDPLVTQVFVFPIIPGDGTDAVILSCASGTASGVFQLQFVTPSFVSPS